MLKRDELNGPSCFSSAAPDEPLFVLRANDEVAPDTIRHWVHLYCFAKGGYSRLTDKQKHKADEAYAVARQMEDWRKKHETA